LRRLADRFLCARAAAIGADLDDGALTRTQGARFS
jgi:hypothetical protein